MQVKEKIGGLFFDLIKGDTLIENEQIEDGSVDLILTDLPYGIVTMKESAGNYKVLNTAETWDKAIEPKSIYEIANRILRKNGKMILFSQEPYTSRMITEAIPNVPFSYRAVWEKNDFANGLGVNKAMVSFYEDILIFSKTHDFEGLHPLRPYFKTVMDFIGLNLKQINNKLGHRRAEHTFYIDSTQYGLCTEKTYKELIEVFGINNMDGFLNYAELEKINKKYTSTFNLWEGNKYKSNILKYKKDYNGYHPTQKPVLLLEDLIKTFSNENDLVVDLTMGSGSTGVACKNTNRNFIGIEKDDKYFEIAEKRIKGNEPNPNGFEKAKERGIFSFTDEPDKAD
jgi:site-specific DNA-methyltransferase (adenine-specific)